VTPAELVLLADRRAAETKALDWRAALVASATLSPWSKKPVTPAQLLGEAAASSDDEQVMTPEESITYMKAHLKDA
jgi:hypothetical protein